MGNAIKSPDTISDSYSVSYSISDPDKMLDLVDPTKDLIGLEVAQPGSGFQQRGKATRRSFQRSGGTTGNQVGSLPHIFVSKTSDIKESDQILQKLDLTFRKLKKLK